MQIGSTTYARATMSMMRRVADITHQTAKEAPGAHAQAWMSGDLPSIVTDAQLETVFKYGQNTHLRNNIAVQAKLMKASRAIDEQLDQTQQQLNHVEALAQHPTLTDDEKKSLDSVKSSLYNSRQTLLDHQTKLETLRQEVDGGLTQSNEELRAIQQKATSPLADALTKDWKLTTEEQNAVKQPALSAAALITLCKELNITVPEKVLQNPNPSLTLKLKAIKAIHDSRARSMKHPLSDKELLAALKSIEPTTNAYTKEVQSFNKTQAKDLTATIKPAMKDGKQLLNTTTEQLIVSAKTIEQISAAHPTTPPPAVAVPTTAEIPTAVAPPGA